VRVLLAAVVAVHQLMAEQQALQWWDKEILAVQKQVQLAPDIFLVAVAVLVVQALMAVVTPVVVKVAQA